MNDKHEPKSLERWLVLSASTIVVGLFSLVILGALAWTGYRVYVYQSATQQYHERLDTRNQLYKHCKELGFDASSIYPWGLNGVAEPVECTAYAGLPWPQPPTFEWH